jgi:hypothetical protein
MPIGNMFSHGVLTRSIKSDVRSCLRVPQPAYRSNMTSIGTGYDLSASTYSPDGRIFQARFYGMISRGGSSNQSNIGRICDQGGRELWVCIHNPISIWTNFEMYVTGPQ